MDPDVLGKPGQGVHFHVLGIAVVDLFLTLLAAYFIARWRGCPFWATAVCLVGLGTLVHRAVGVRSTLTVAVFD